LQVEDRKERQGRSSILHASSLWGMNECVVAFGM
jgi:hypothetical protein